MFNKLKQRVELLEEGEAKDLENMGKISDGVIALCKRVELLEKCDNYNTMYQEQADKRIKELEENLRLVYEYLGVHKEVINDTFLIEDDCICDECLDKELCEDVNNTEDWGEKFEKLKKVNKKK